MIFNINIRKVYKLSSYINYIMAKFKLIAWKNKKRRQLTVNAQSMMGAEDLQKSRRFRKKYDFKNGWNIDIKTI